MVKGIRKACANCIKARLACDEGRPCQRCIVHQCECVAVARKPRVKKQKLDVPHGSIVAKPTTSNIITRDTITEASPTWIQGDFTQVTLNAYRDHDQLSDDSFYDSFTSQGMLSPPQMPSPLTPKYSPPRVATTTSIASPPSQMPSPPLLLSPAQLSIPSPLWSQPSPPQAVVLEQPTANLQASRMVPAAFVSSQLLPSPPVQQQQYLQQDALSQAQMFSIQLEEKPSVLLQDWSEIPQLGAVFNNVGPQLVFTDNQEEPFKKAQQAAIAPLLPQPKNSIALFPTPICVFDKQKFQLLDANVEMANFYGCSNVAEFATVISQLDDLIDPAAAHVAKHAYNAFVTNVSPFDRLGVIRTRNDISKTVEFHVDLTDQLLIFSIKSVYDDSSMALPEVHIPTPVCKVSHCQCKAREFLSPID